MKRLLPILWLVGFVAIGATTNIAVATDTFVKVSLPNGVSIEIPRKTMTQASASAPQQ